MSSKAIDSVTVRNASTIFVPISTRGVGFHAQVSYSRAFNVVGEESLVASVFALYRVSLFQLHHRLSSANRAGRALFYDDNFGTSTLSPGFSSAIQKSDRNFAALARLIGAVGTFVLEGFEFTPRFPVLPEANRPDPTSVTVANLREVVLFLSNPSTDPKLRKYFFDHNPLPCAQWNRVEEPDFPVLLNPDDFMRANYDEDDLLNDVQAVQSLLCGPLPAGSVELVLYDGPGDPAILVSNCPSRLRIREIPFDTDGRPAFETSPLEGNINRFWSPRALSAEQLTVGASYLVGELPQPKWFGVNFALRATTVAVREANLNLRTIFTKPPRGI